MVAVTAWLDRHSRGSSATLPRFVRLVEPSVVHAMRPHSAASEDLGDNVYRDVVSDRFPEAPDQVLCDSRDATCEALDADGSAEQKSVLIRETPSSAARRVLNGGDFRKGYSWVVRYF
jgi:hypothetical protein